MQIKGPAVLRCLHEFLCAAPVLMLRVLLQQLLFKGVNAVKIPLCVEIRALLHGREGRPALRIDDIRIPEGLRHAAGLRKGSAALLGVPAGDLLNLREHVIAFRMGKNHIHAEPCHKTDHALGHAERFPVAGTVSPAHGQLFPLQILHPAEIMDDLFHIRHTLGRMVDIALQVDQGRLLLQDPVLIALSHGVRDKLLVSMPLPDVHVIADSDHVRHKGNHVGGFPDCLAMGDLALLLVQVLHGKSQQVAGGGKGKSRSGGIVPENGNSETRIEDPGGNISLPEIAQRIRDRKDSHNLIICLIPGQKEIIIVHVFKIESVKLFNILLQCIVHSIILPDSFFFQVRQPPETRRSGPDPMASSAGGGPAPADFIQFRAGTQQAAFGSGHALLSPSSLPDTGQPPRHTEPRR